MAQRQIVETQKILLKYRSPETPVGLVKSAYRDRQNVVITNLAEMLNHEIGMLTTVIIGNSSTFFYDNKIITPRGYQKKYTLGADTQPLKPHQRLRREAEPWALEQDEAAETSNVGSAVALLTKEEEKNSSVYDTAMEALMRVSGQSFQPSTSQIVHQEVESIFELAVSPGVANKQFTANQMILLAEVVGENGTMEYTPNHQILLKIPTAEPEKITERLQEAGFLLAPVGDVVAIKACDFCDGEKAEAIPYAEELQKTLGGMKLPKELYIGFNGCGMACYRAVMDDIGIVHRKGKFDLFIGAKPVGRTAHPGQIVAEGMEPDQLVKTVTRIVEEYKENAHPNERFFKYFKRAKQIQGFQYQDIAPKIKIEPAPCED